MLLAAQDTRPDSGEAEREKDEPEELLKQALNGELSCHHASMQKFGRDKNDGGVSDEYRALS